MSGSKKFGAGEDFQISPSAGKPILSFDPDVPQHFTDLHDTFANYTGRGGLAVVVKTDETGLTTSSEVINTDKNYIHTQSVANVLWTIVHNLGKYPNVRIKDGTGHLMMGDVVDVSINELTIEFSIAQSGVAILN